MPAKEVLADCPLPVSLAGARQAKLLLIADGKPANTVIIGVK
jgi:hypothetical protein